MWTDEVLYEKYQITKNERAYIESQVRAMNLSSDADE
jgi:site-specific DNA-methyltransferase (adenine-specific)